MDLPRPTSPQGTFDYLLAGILLLALLLLLYLGGVVVGLLPPPDAIA